MVERFDRAAQRVVGGALVLSAHKRTARVLLYDRVNELIVYLNRNDDRLVNYGVRYRKGMPISTSTAESAVKSVVGDRFKKNRKMRWTPAGANALLHIRVADLNGELVSAPRERHWLRPKAAANDPRFKLRAA